MGAVVEVASELDLTVDSTPDFFNDLILVDDLSSCRVVPVDVGNVCPADLSVLIIFFMHPILISPRPWCVSCTHQVRPNRPNVTCFTVSYSLTASLDKNRNRKARVQDIGGTYSLTLCVCRGCRNGLCCAAGVAFSEADCEDGSDMVVRGFEGLKSPGDEIGVLLAVLEWIWAAEGGGGRMLCSCFECGELWDRFRCCGSMVLVRIRAILGAACVASRHGELGVKIEARGMCLENGKPNVDWSLDCHGSSGSIEKDSCCLKPQWRESVVSSPEQ